MRGLGIPEEKLDEALFNLLGPDPDPVYVLPANCEAVRIFMMCDSNVIAAPGGIYFRGVTSAEIETNARIFGVPVTPDLVSRVKLLGSESARIRNEKVKR